MSERAGASSTPADAESPTRVEVSSVTGADFDEGASTAGAGAEAAAAGTPSADRDESKVAIADRESGSVAMPGAAPVNPTEAASGAVPVAATPQQPSAHVQGSAGSLKATEASVYHQRLAGWFERADMAVWDLDQRRCCDVACGRPACLVAILALMLVTVAGGLGQAYFVLNQPTSDLEWDSLGSHIAERDPCVGLEYPAHMRGNWSTAVEAVEAEYGSAVAAEVRAIEATCTCDTLRPATYYLQECLNVSRRSSLASWRWLALMFLIAVPLLYTWAIIKSTCCWRSTLTSALKGKRLVHLLQREIDHRASPAPGEAARPQRRAWGAAASRAMPGTSRRVAPVGVASAAAQPPQRPGAGAAASEEQVPQRGGWRHWHRIAPAYFRGVLTAARDVMVKEAHGGKRPKGLVQRLLLLWRVRALVMKYWSTQLLLALETVEVFTQSYKVFTSAGVFFAFYQSGGASDIHLLGILVAIDCIATPLAMAAGDVGVAITVDIVLSVIIVFINGNAIGLTLVPDYGSRDSSPVASDFTVFMIMFGVVYPYITLFNMQQSIWSQLTVVKVETLLLAEAEAASPEPAAAAAEEPPVIVVASADGVAPPPQEVKQSEAGDSAAAPATSRSQQPLAGASAGTSAPLPRASAGEESTAEPKHTAAPAGQGASTGAATQASRHAVATKSMRRLFHEDARGAVGARRRLQTAMTTPSAACVAAWLFIAYGVLLLIVLHTPPLCHDVVATCDEACTPLVGAEFGGVPAEVEVAGDGAWSGYLVQTKYMNAQDDPPPQGTLVQERSLARVSATLATGHDGGTSTTMRLVLSDVLQHSRDDQGNVVVGGTTGPAFVDRPTYGTCVVPLHAKCEPSRLYAGKAEPAMFHWLVDASQSPQQCVRADSTWSKELVLTGWLGDIMWSGMAYDRTGDATADSDSHLDRLGYTFYTDWVPSSVAWRMETGMTLDELAWALESVGRTAAATEARSRLGSQHLVMSWPGDVFGDDRKETFPHVAYPYLRHQFLSLVLWRE